jgi:hypothetical protein
MAMYPEDAVEKLEKLIERYIPSDSMDRTDAERALEALGKAGWDNDE